MDHNARYYSPTIGRFVSPDTVVPDDESNPQSWNRFAYVSNNPLKYSDPSGHQECDKSTANCSPFDSDVGSIEGEQTFDFNNQSIIQFGAPSRAPIDLEAAQRMGYESIAMDILSLSISIPAAFVEWGYTGVGEASTPAPVVDGLVGFAGGVAEYRKFPDLIEAAFGALGTTFTARSDYLAGNTYRVPGEGWVIGQDTYASTILTLIGAAIPEPTTDTVINLAGLNYDIESVYATADKPGAIHSILSGNLFIRTNITPPSQEKQYFGR